MIIEFTTPTPNEWIRFGLMLLGLFSFVGLAEVLRAQFQLSYDLTRKIVHILVGVFVFFVPLVFDSPIPPILMSVLFIIVNYFSVRFKLFKGMDAASHQTYGTVYFPFSFLILILLFWDSYRIIISTSILVLGLADAAASLVGRSVKNPIPIKLSRDTKSVQGSATMLIVSFIVVLGCLLFYPIELEAPILFNINILTYLIVVSLITASVATVSEALSSKGFDNITIPLSVAAMLLVGIKYPDSFSQMILGFVFALLISAVSLKFRFLAPSGAAITFLMGIIIFVIGGWKWAIPMLTFFFLSSIISKMKNKRKEKIETVFEKSHKRDFGQVIANGGLAAILVYANFLYENPLWYIAYLGAIAAATADTWGTEFGISFSKSARNILTLDRVPPGISGGVSPVGFFAGFGGAGIIGLSGMGWIQSLPEVVFPIISLTLLIALAGVIGSIVDSILGATVQIQYKCVKCGSVVERLIHCDTHTEKYRGSSWINNDVVNFVCTSVGASCAVLFYWIN